MKIRPEKCQIKAIMIHIFELIPENVPKRESQNLLEKNESTKTGSHTSGTLSAPRTSEPVRKRFEPDLSGSRLVPELTELVPNVTELLLKVTELVPRLTEPVPKITWRLLSWIEPVS
jgi:hypothetical protein